MTPRGSTRPVLLALASALLFGAATPASKSLLEPLSPFQLAGLLYLGAALATSPAILRARGWRPDHANLTRLAGAVAFGGVLGPIFFLLGLRLAAASSVSLWLNLELVATAILGHLIFRDHLGTRGWAGAGGALAAAAILTVPEGSAGVAAALLVALACTCWGIDNHLTALIDGITPAQSTFWKGLVAGCVNLTIGIATQAFDAALPPTAAALALGALSYGASIALYVSAAQRLGATRAQTVFSTAPFFGAGLSFAFLGEALGAHQTVAAAILGVSIALLIRDRHQHHHAHEVLAHTHEHTHDDGHHEHAHPGEAASLRHIHRHQHEQIGHSHPHWPDLHHRHSH